MVPPSLLLPFSVSFPSQLFSDLERHVSQTALLTGLILRAPILRLFTVHLYIFSRSVIAVSLFQIFLSLSFIFTINNEAIIRLVKGIVMRAVVMVIGGSG